MLQLWVIAVCEFLATLLNIRMIWQSVRHFRRVVNIADALATPRILVKFSSRSPLIQVALDAAMLDPIISEALRSGRLHAQLVAQLGEQPELARDEAAHAVFAKTPASTSKCPSVAQLSQVQQQRMG